MLTALRTHCVALGLLCSCRDADESPATRADAGQEPARAAAEAPLEAEIRDVAAQCDVTNATWDSCPAESLKTELQRLEDADVHAALATQCRLLADDDREVVSVALDGLNRLTVSMSTDAVRRHVDAALLDCLTSRLQAPGPHVRERLWLVSSALATFGAAHGRARAVVELLNTQADPTVRAFGFTGLWTHGGTEVWPLIEGMLAKSDDETKAALLLGVGGNGEFPTSGEMHDRICEGLVEHATDSNVAVAAAAAEGIGYRCLERIPDLLGATRTMAERNTLSSGYLLPLRSIVGVDSEKHPEAIRAEVANLLQTIAVRATLDGGTRSSALAGVSNHDRAAGKTLAARLREDADREVAEMAEFLLAETP